MARITTSKGEATLRPMLAKDEALLGEFAELEGTRDWKAYYRLKGRMLRHLEDAAKEIPWEGGFGELPNDEVQVVFIQWDGATDEDALPPDNGTSSETPPPTGS
ncbi:MAG TPA: hypothetical protein VMW94_10985 [Actinomycetes bacterium]|nr:hypothetical protein [Actinomycetes bacterium]